MQSVARDVLGNRNMATALLNAHGIARTSAPKVHRARTSRRSGARVVVVRAADEKKVRRECEGNEQGTTRDASDVGWRRRWKACDERWMQEHFLENVTVPRERGSRPANVAKRGDPMDFRWKVVGNSEDHSRPWLGRGDTASRTRGTREM